MKKHLFYPSLWGILILSLLSSCRTEDGAITQKQLEDKRFAVFVPKSGESINYAKGFAFLMQRYDNLHKTNLSGINNNKPIIGNLNASASINQSTSTIQSNEAYVEFGVHTKTFTEKNGDKWVIYPKVQGNKVIGLIIGALTKSETYVSYHAINPQIDFYKDNIMLFQEALDNYLKQRSRLSLTAGIKPIAEGGQKCTNDGSSFDCNIEEVVVTKGPPPILSLMTIEARDYDNSSNGGGSGGEGGGGSNGGNGTGGQCPDYRQCINLGDTAPLELKDPCSTLKSKIATVRGREIIKDLEAKAKIPGSNEYAYRQDKDGNMTMYEGERDNVSIPIDNNMEGVYHDHQSEGVAMLSVRDIRMMLIIARMQSDGNIGNAFVGMISTYGNYFINFNGTKADIPVITEGQMINDLIKFYDEDYTAMQVRLPKGANELPPKQLEKLFFNTIEKMGLKDKVNLFKEKDGSTSQVKQDANGEPVPSNPC